MYLGPCAWSVLMGVCVRAIGGIAENKIGQGHASESGEVKMQQFAQQQ